MSVQSSGFLAELSAAAQQHPYGEIRADKVAAARADIAAGRLGTPEDIEATVNAFLMELS
jgi:predicted transcriptional regulator